MQFTEQQLRAIDIGTLGQDMCVVAGPGSGKTTVLVERFRRLVREAGISPARILAITFTEKAATNMKQKLAEAFRDRPEDRRQIERAYVSTVHGFCMRLLRENAIFAGIDPEFRVMDERQADALQKVAVTAALDQLFAEDPEGLRGLMRGVGGSNLTGALLEVYEGIRSSGAGMPAGEPLSYGRGSEEPSRDRQRAVVSGVRKFRDLIDMACDLAMARPVEWKLTQKEALRAVIEWGERHSALRDTPASRAHFEAIESFDCNLQKMRRNNTVYDQVRALKGAVEEVYRGLLTEFYAAARETLVEVLRRFDRLYRERKAAAAAVDYSDLEEVTVRLLEENPAVRERVRAQFDQVLMDEFQDTNGLQAKLLKLVRPPDRFYAVGDINQSIYGFRHAEPQVFRDYRDEVARGGKPLAELTENWRSRADILQAVTTILHGADGIEERALIAARAFPEKAEPSVEILVALGKDADRALELEAKWVARRIVELGGYGETAVLVRNSEVMATFAVAFEAAGIPHLVGRGRGFYEEREITDLVHLLRVLLNPRDEISMAAVLRSPLVGISDEALLRLKQSGNLGAAVRRLEMNAVDPLDLEKLSRFRAHLREWRLLKDYVAFDRLLLRAMDAAGYVHAPGSRAAANAEKFLAIAREASSRLTLAEFVDELEIVRATDPRDTDAPPEDAANAVRMMTVHAAKGLEFPTVFLAAVHKGIDTKLGDLSFSPRLGLGARWRNPLTGEEKDDLCQQAIREERKQREIEEGNRLFYVAMTRAEERLIVSYSRTDATPKNWAATLEKSLGFELTPDNQPRVAQLAGLKVRLQITGAPPQLRAHEQAEIEQRAALYLDQPVVTGQYDSNATVTSVSVFADCPRRYYLGRTTPDLRLPATNGESRLAMPAAELGLQVHALLAGVTVESAHPEARRLADSFRASALGRRAERATHVEREFDFLLALEDVVLRGQIDLWFEEKGKLILVDYKTDAVATSKEAEEHAEGYAAQIRLYAMALERIAGRMPDHAYVYFLRREEAIPVDLSPLAIYATAGLVRDFRDAQERLEFPLRPGERCQRCRFFRNLCPGEVISLSSCDAPLSPASSVSS